MDEEQQKHIAELALWKKEAKAAQDKVRATYRLCRWFRLAAGLPITCELQPLLIAPGR